MALASAELYRISERYRGFAVSEARGVSEAYERLALAIAASPEILEFIASVPADRRQPNLFLTALRQVCGVPENMTHLNSSLRQARERIRSVMLSRTTQTNEPARCSVLLPILARLPQPLALLEVGASAGLCLLPDRYGYDYGVRRIEPAVEGAPVFDCATNGAVPLPDAVPQVVWRLGLDLNPIDLFSDEQVEWLELLVWPGQEDRANKLRAAINVARRDPPRSHQGQSADGPRAAYCNGAKGCDARRLPYGRPGLCDPTTEERWLRSNDEAKKCRLDQQRNAGHILISHRERESRAIRRPLRRDRRRQASRLGGPARPVDRLGRRLGLASGFGARERSLPPHLCRCRASRVNQHRTRDPGCS